MKKCNTCNCNWEEGEVKEIKFDNDWKKHLILDLLRKESVKMEDITIEAGYSYDYYKIKFTVEKSEEDKE